MQIHDNAINEAATTTASLHHHSIHYSYHLTFCYVIIFTGSVKDDLQKKMIKESVNCKQAIANLMFL